MKYVIHKQFNFLQKGQPEKENDIIIQDKHVGPKI